MRPQKGKAGGGFYMAGGKGGGLGGRKSTAKELQENPSYGKSPDEVPFDDSSYDANSANLPFEVGGRDNWFSRIFNPPNQTAIDANNAALMAKVAGGIQNQQVLDLAAKQRDIENDITARTVLPYINDPSILGDNSGPLNQRSLGERINMAMGPELKKQGAALAIPDIGLNRYNMGIQDQVNRTPGGQKALEMSYLNKLVPPLHFGNNVNVFGMNPTAGGTMLEGGGEELKSREMFPHWVNPATGKVEPMPGAHSSIVTDKTYRPPTAMPFNQFQGADHVRYSPEEVMGTLNSINSRIMPGYSSQVPDNAAPAPAKSRNEKVIPANSQQEPDAGMDWQVGPLTSDKVNEALKYYEMLKRTGKTVGRHLNPFNWGQ